MSTGIHRRPLRMSMTMQERYEWVQEQLQGIEGQRSHTQSFEPVSAWDSNSFRHRVKRLFQRRKKSKK